MKIEELQRNLDTIRAWRKIELSHARSLAERHHTSAELPYLCRVWTMMIYAHCDQSLKLICKEYLKFLQINPRKDYNYKTVWLSFFGKEALRKSNDARFHICKEENEENIKIILENISGKEIFNSGNFSYQQLRFFTEWILQSPFDHETYKGFCSTLKEKRDMIAHGENFDIREISDCLSWHQPAISLLDSLVESTITTATKH